MFKMGTSLNDAHILGYPYVFLNATAVAVLNFLVFPYN